MRGKAYRLGHNIGKTFYSLTGKPLSRSVRRKVKSHTIWPPTSWLVFCWSSTSLDCLYAQEMGWASFTTKRSSFIYFYFSHETPKINYVNRTTRVYYQGCIYCKSFTLSLQNQWWLQFEQDFQIANGTKCVIQSRFCQYILSNKWVKLKAKRHIQLKIFFILQ